MEGIPATAGFGVPYKRLHGIDERAHLAELPQVCTVDQRAVLGLLGDRGPKPVPTSSQIHSQRFHNSVSGSRSSIAVT